MKPKLVTVILLSVLLRVGAALYLGNEVVDLPGTADQVSYHNLAIRVLEGYGFSFGQAWWPVTAANAPTAHWSFIYTLFLAAIYALFGINPIVARLIQAVIVGVLQPYFVFALASLIVNEFNSKLGDGVGERIRGNGRLAGHVLSNYLIERVPLFAAAITAVYFYFIYYSAALMTEPFFMTFLLASLVMTIKLASRIKERTSYPTAIGLGVVVGLTVLLRQLYMLFVPFLFLWLFCLSLKRKIWLRAVIASGTVTLILALFIVPFTLYNYVRFNRIVLLNTNAGYAFYLANHPVHGTKFIPAAEMGNSYGTLIPADLRYLDEAALDQVLLKKGLQFVVDDPGRYVRLSFSRIPEYVKFWPDPVSGLISNLARVGSFGLFLPFMLVGILRPVVNFGRSSGESFWKRPSASVTLLYLFILVYSAIHILSWALIRYRLPVDAVLVIFAAFTLADLSAVGEKWLQRQRILQKRTS